MTRNLRMRDHPAPNPVSSYPVAPDHYGPDEDIDLAVKVSLAESWREFRDLNPYKVGDVVWIEVYERDGMKRPRKAFISDVFPDRDNDGFRRAKYRVHVAVAAGKADRFAKNWIYTWPGMIQRGYALAARGES